MPKITMTETRLVSPHGYDTETYEKGASYDAPDGLANTLIADKSAVLFVEGDGKGDETVKWPPTEEQIAALGFEPLGELLASQSVDLKGLRSRDDRRAAIRDLIAKQTAGDGKGDETSK
jgi:hypothetical protein